jgi:hypothetical protein
VEHTDVGSYFRTIPYRLARNPNEDPTVGPRTSIQGKKRETHFEIAKYTNALPRGGANRLTADAAGSHRQKLFCVRGEQGIVAFCGGADVNRDRVAVVEHGKGQPLRDVHCEVRGPAVTDLTKVFVQRRGGHPWSVKLKKEPGRLIARDLPRGPAKRGTPGQIVRVGVTYNQVDGRDLYSMMAAGVRARGEHKGWAPRGDSRGAMFHLLRGLVHD